MAKTASTNASDTPAGNGRVFAGMLAAALLLAGMLLWRHPPAPGVVTPLDRTGLQLQDDFAQWAAPQLPIIAVAPEAQRQPGAVAPAPVMNTAMRREFETTTDLFAYAQRLAPQVRRGEADALWLLSKVIDYCTAFANDRNGFARDSAVLERLRVPASMLQARARVADRCGRFSEADGLTPVAMWQLRTRAAEAGSVAAETALVAKGQPADTGKKTEAGKAADSGKAAETDKAGKATSDLVERVRKSQDPDAYTAMSDAVANGTVASGDALAKTSAAKSAGPEGGNTVALVGTALSSPQQSSSTPQLDALAWQLAACRLGGECGAGSSLMTAYCVNGGICSQRADQDFETFVYDAAVPRQGADVLRRMVDALVDDTGERE